MKVRRTPLYEAHRAAGARMVEFAGWEMPVQYSSVIREHQCVRTGVGLFDVSHMGEAEIAGPGAEAFCARLFANDARRLTPGKAQYSLLCNETGGVVDDVIVYRLGDERFLVCLNASNADKDVAWMRERAPGDCEVRDVSDAYGLLAVQGPASAALIDGLIRGASALPRFAVAEKELGGVSVLAARTGYTGEDGFELFVPADRCVDVWNAVVKAGRDYALQPIGLGARDTLRLEAALPLYGHELGEGVSPFEAGLAWVVKLNRPEMVGYQALVGLSAHPKRRLVGLEIEEGIAREGCSVLASGARIGMVTSGTYCPYLEKALALALIESDVEEIELLVEVRGRHRPARVTDIPFYVRQRTHGTHEKKVS